MRRHMRKSAALAGGIAVALTLLGVPVLDAVLVATITSGLVLAILSMSASEHQARHDALSLPVEGPHSDLSRGS